MDRKTAVCRLDCKSKYRFYLSMLLDLMDVTVYMKLGDDITLLNFKIVVVKAPIGRNSDRNRSFIDRRASKRVS